MNPFSEAKASCALDGETHCIMPRTMKDVAHIIGAELDSCGSEFMNIGWETTETGAQYTFACDGVEYMLVLTKVGDEE